MQPRVEGWERKGTMRIEVAAYLIAARLVCLLGRPLDKNRPHSAAQYADSTP